MSINKSDCSICLDIFDINKNEGLAILSCGHSFHLHCLTNLQITTVTYNKCPNCRTSFVTPSKKIEEIRKLKDTIYFLKLQLEEVGIKIN